MLFKPLIMVGIKSVLNAFLYSSPGMKAARQRLSGKILRIFLKDCAISLVLVFSEQKVDVIDKWEGKVDCSITTNISALSKLRNHQQLTASILSGELRIEDDLQVVQNFIVLANLAEFDLIELLAPYIGDIMAESINKIFHSASVFLYKIIQRHQHHITDVITEEWRIVPGRLEVTWFIEEIATFNRIVEALAKRIKKLGDK